MGSFQRRLPVPQHERYLQDFRSRLDDLEWFVPLLPSLRVSKLTKYVLLAGYIGGAIQQSTSAIFTTNQACYQHPNGDTTGEGCFDTYGFGSSLLSLLFISSIFSSLTLSLFLSCFAVLQSTRLESESFRFRSRRDALELD